MHYINKFIPKTLLFRFLLIIIVPVLIGQLVSIYLFYNRHWYNVSNYASQMISNNLTILKNNISNNEETAQSLSKEMHIHYLLFPNQTFTQRESDNIEELEILQNIITEKFHSECNIYLSGNGNKIIIDLPYDGGILQFQITAKLLINPTTDIFVLWMISLTIILLAISIAFSRNQIRSILNLAKTADAYGRGLKDQPIYKPSGAAEIRMAGMAFMRMKDRIERQVNKRSKMLAMISHDLRTPLTRIKLQLEFMDQSEEADDIREDVKNMEHIISSYLDFARGEGGEENENIILSRWFEGNINSFVLNNVVISFDKINKNLYANVKPVAFKRAITNIFDNASKFATEITVSIYLNEINEINIDIEDNGCGISEDEKQHVFTPFYRSDKSRHIDEIHSSTGLGLTISREIISGHNGTITLHNSKKLSGLLVRITLPNANI
jgi:two-component system, OmpR family, osmolarity sensor histidine kinase EnvZ